MGEFTFAGRARTNVISVQAWSSAIDIAVRALASLIIPEKYHSDTPGLQPEVVLRGCGLCLSWGSLSHAQVNYKAGKRTERTNPRMTNVQVDRAYARVNTMQTGSLRTCVHVSGASWLRSGLHR